MKKSFVKLNSLEEAFELFKQFMPHIQDIRGRRIEFDFGSYAHIVDDTQILKRMNHIRETLTNPDEIRQSHHRGMKFRESYIKTFYWDQSDMKGESFIVVVDNRIAARFWTAILPTPSYFNNIRKGKAIWLSQEK